MHAIGPTHHCFYLLVSFISEEETYVQVMDKLQLYHEAELLVSARQQMNKQELLKNKMMAAQLKLKTEKEKLQNNLRALDMDFLTAKDRLYVEKVKQRQAILQQLDEMQRAVSIVQNYADSPEETNNDLRDELKQALLDKYAVLKLTSKAKQLASDRLEKWHIERKQWRAAEDELARQQKTTKDMELIMEEYRLEIQLSLKSNHCLEKEWVNEEAAALHGGRRRCPPWVVQIICKLLVNGTPPTMVPLAMQTMYQMLTGDTPDELPCVNFVWSCRVVVEVMGETITAIKLADAPSWNQL